MSWSARGTQLSQYWGRLLLSIVCLYVSSADNLSGIHIMTYVYEPYHTSGKSGIITELVLASCKAANLPVDHLELLPSERARLTFEHDPFAIYLAANSYVDASHNPALSIAKQWPFKVLIYYDRSRFDPIGPKTIADLAGKTMGYFRADIATRDYFSGHGVNMSALDQQAQLYPMLLYRRIDMLVSLEDNATLEFDRLDAQWRDHIGTFGPYYSGWSGLIYHNDNPAAVQFIERYLEGYRRIRADGTARSILERYYGKGHVPPSLLQ